MSRLKCILMAFEHGCCQVISESIVEVHVELHCIACSKNVMLICANNTTFKFALSLGQRCRGKLERCIISANLAEALFVNIIFHL